MYHFLQRMFIKMSLKNVHSTFNNVIFSGRLIENKYHDTNQFVAEVLKKFLEASNRNIFSVTSQCPYCEALQRADLADEADERA